MSGFVLRDSRVTGAIMEAAHIRVEEVALRVRLTSVSDTAHSGRPPTTRFLGSPSMGFMTGAIVA